MKNITTIIFCILIAGISSPSALSAPSPTKKTVFLPLFKPYKTTKDLSLEIQIQNSLKEELLEINFDVREIDSIEKGLDSGKKITGAIVVGGYYRIDKNNNLNLYCQIYHAKDGYIIDAVNITSGISVLEGFEGFEDIQLDPEELKTSNEEMIDKLTKKVLLRIRANPKLKVKGQNIEDNIINDTIGADIKFPIKKDEDIAKETAEVFAFLAGEEIVVAATKLKQTVAQAPSIVTVITKKQIFEHNYQSVAEALSYVPGIFVNYDYAFFDAGVRGISGELRGRTRLVKVMINGNSIANRLDTTNLIGPELIPMDAIERIEVLRGPNSTLYGANAFLGVVNIITKKGADVDRYSASSGINMYDGNLGYYVSGMAGKKFGPVDLMLAVQRLNRDRSGMTVHYTTFKNIDGDPKDRGFKSAKEAQRKTSNDGVVFDRESFQDIENPTSFIGTMDLDLNFIPGVPKSWDLGRFSFLSNLQLLDSRSNFLDWGFFTYDSIVDEEGNIEKKVEDSGNRVGLQNLFLVFGYNIPFWSDRADLGLKTAISDGGIASWDQVKDTRFDLPEFRYDVKKEAGLFEDRSDIGYTSLDYSIELKLLLLKKYSKIWGMTLLNDLNIVSGLDSSSDDLSYIADAATSEMNTKEFSNIGVYGQISSSFLNKHLGLLTGIRRDQHSYYGDKTNYRFGSTFEFIRKYKKIDSLYGKILWGTAFKAPSPLFLLHDDILGLRPLNPNPNLKPQDVETWEFLLGSSLFKRSLKVSGTFFISQLENKASFIRIGDNILARNEVDIKSRGIEGEIRYIWELIEVYSNISFQSSKRIFKETGSEILLLDTGEYRIPDTFAFPNYMVNSGIIGYIYFLAASLDVQYVGYTIGSYLNHNEDIIDNRYRLDGYFLFHINISTYKLELIKNYPTRISFSIRNLFNTEYDYPGFNSFARVDTPGQRRYFILTIKQSF
jgi:iron complex outermembrane receptor protein